MEISTYSHDGGNPIHHRGGAMSDTTEPTMPTAEETAAWHRRFGVALFNQTWELLDTAQRTTDQDAEMLAAALGSRHHWRKIGEPKNFAISDWQVSRVFAVTGAAELAREFAAQSLALCEEHDLGPFLTAYAYEALARAAMVDGDEAAAREHITRARALAAAVAGDSDRTLLEQDLDELEE
jgi:hypothetical protein